MTATKTIFAPNAQTVMCKRYYLRGARFTEVCTYCSEAHETADQFFDRVSMGKAEYRDMLVALDFLPNSPTLMNIGNPDFLGTYSACFKFDPQDTMFQGPSAIMPTLMKAAAVLKAGGGVGYALSEIRPEGALVNSTHGKAFGPIGFLRMAHVLAKEITQGGKRDAAQMGILHCEHPDIRKFIHCKDEDPQGLSTFNISVAVTDSWMQRAQQVGTAEYALLDEMAQSAWRTGDPGVYFIDEAERHNPTPWLGRLTGTNPCGEVPLLDNEPCNLGSINLGHFIKLYINADGTVDVTKSIDWGRLSNIVRLATTYLDDVLDRNNFPMPEIDAIARTTRKLGLGVCGWADMLAQLAIAYDSDGAIKLAGTVMRHIQDTARSETALLGEYRGKAPAFDGIPHQTSRNATVTCIAPTGTIAIIMNASSGIEPYFAAQNQRMMGDGTILMEDAWAGLNLPAEHTPKVSHEIAPTWHIQHQAAFQARTDLAVSKTINMPNSSTWQDVRAAYVEMWERKCKGGTIYRDGSREVQVLTSTVNAAPSSAPTGYAPSIPVQSAEGWRDILPDRRVGPSRTQKFRVGETEGFITANCYDDGAPAEVFLKLSRGGSTLDGFADWWAQSFSVMLQMAHRQGIPFTWFTSKFKGRRFEPSGMTNDVRIPHASSIADYVAKWLDLEFGSPADQVVVMVEQMICPECGNNALQMVEGCETCRLCGHTACG